MEMIFKTPELSDGDAVRRILERSDNLMCENTFGNIYCWASAYGIKLCILTDIFITGDPNRKRFNFPVGCGDKYDVIRSLIDKYPEELNIFCISEADKLFLEERFPGIFEIEPTEEWFDYIYESEKLRMLPGKKLAAKRNHINAFMSDGQWYTVQITPSHKNLLIDYNLRWCKNLCGNISDSLRSELCAAERAITSFEELHYDGLMLYKNGELVGYSLGERINDNIYCVHIEKASANVRGAYQMINREFCRTFCENVKYVNREDDAGDDGLRKAKLSYYPTELGRKYRAKIK